MTRTKLLLLILSAALALLPLSGAGQAGCRSVAVHHAKQQLVVGYTPVYAPPQTYYVGQQLQLNAQEDRLAQKTAKIVLEQLRAQALQAPAEAVQQPERLPLTAGDLDTEGYSLLVKHCYRCHGKDEGKAAEAMSFADMLTKMRGEDLQNYRTRERIAALVLDGKMPPGGGIPGQELGDLLGQIVRAETAPK